jgi:ABC-type nickel/cobalt efflux system permease component RcnA
MTASTALYAAAFLIILFVIFILWNEWRAAYNARIEQQRYIAQKIAQQKVDLQRCTELEWEGVCEQVPTFKAGA